MDMKQGLDRLKGAPKHLGKAAALVLSLLAADVASAAVPGAAKQLDGRAAPPIAGSDKSGTNTLIENLARAKQKWIQETFDKSKSFVYEKGNANLAVLEDPLQDEWTFFKVEFGDVGQTNLIGCHKKSEMCMNLKLPLDPDDVIPEHRGFLEEAERQAKTLPNLYKTAPDPESGDTWLAATIMQTEKEGIFLLIRPDKMLDIAVSRGDTDKQKPGTEF